MSVAELGDVEKVERQEEDCRRVCERMGWTPMQVFVDNNASAWKRNRKRPGWDEMLAGVRDGRFEAIVVYHGDRLIRQPYDLETLLNLASDKGVRLASPTGTRNLDSADDRFILRIEAAQACRESDNISRRTRRAKEARRAKGIYETNGHRPFGRNRDGSILETEAALIRDAFARIVAGEAMSRLWREWERQGVPTVRGGRWRYTTFRQMLMRPDLAGLIGHDGRALGTAVNLEPIVERGVWEAVQGLLEANRLSFGGYARPRTHLLSGITVCAGCDQPMGSGTGIYRCHWPSCPRAVSRNQDHLDEYVIGRVLRRLSDPRLWQQISTLSTADASQGVAAELAAIEMRRQQLAEEFADDDAMSPAMLRRMLERLDERAAQVRARLTGQRSASILEGLQGLDRTGWDDLPLDRRRAIVRELVTVRVFPARLGPGFDADSVQVLPVSAAG